MVGSGLKAITPYLAVSPVSRWGAIVSSALSALCFVALLPLAYLFFGLLNTGGAIPEFDQLSDSRQTQFRQEWDENLSSNTDIQGILAQVRNPPAFASIPDSSEWLFRWRAATYAHFQKNISAEAAEQYLPTGTASAETAYLSPRNRGQGMLALAATERSGWHGTVISQFASWNPWTWRQSAGSSANLRYVTGLFCIALALVILRGLLLNLASYCVARLTLEVAVKLRRALFSHSFRLGISSLRPEFHLESGDLITRKVELIREGLSHYLTWLVRTSILIVLILLFILSTHFWLSLLFLMLITFVWLSAGQIATYFRRDSRVASKRVDTRLSTIAESMSVMQLVKSYLMERYSQTRFERNLNDLGRLVWRSERGERFTKPTFFAVLGVTGLIIAYLAGRSVLTGDMTFQSFLVKGLALAILLQTLNRFFMAQSRIQRARAAAADISEFLDRRGDAGHPIDAEFMPPLTRKLELIDVSVREPGTGRMLLDRVNLTVPAGTSAAIVFADVMEAKTLANLITRFVEPTGGEMKLDGKNARWLTYESVRTQVAYIDENHLTFTDTVANNIGCGEPNFTLPQIIEAAKTAHAHQFVQRLPYGYETPIGTGGVSLRTGEQYRIALARAILRDPSLIVIEEPSEPLDADSAALIDDTLHRIRPGRTLLFLARRPGTVRSADRVYILQLGKIVASGTHEELFQNNELYRLLNLKHSLSQG